MTRLPAVISSVLLLLAGGLTPCASWAHSDAVRARRDSSTGISLQTDSGILTIEPWRDGIIHVRFGTAGFAGNYNPAVIATPDTVAYQVSETQHAVTLSTRRLVVRVNRTDATISFLLPDGTVLLEEAERDAGLGAAVSFRTATALYGLGQHQNGLLDYAGHSIHLQQANTDIAVPMMISPQGWGLLWNDASVADVLVSPAAHHGRC
jgi:alpha-D-xyloside xylohydrolase